MLPPSIILTRCGLGVLLKRSSTLLPSTTHLWNHQPQGRFHCISASVSILTQTIMPRMVPFPPFYEVQRSFAARKGTRTRKEKKKVKKEVVKKVFVFNQLRKQAMQEYIKQKPEVEVDKEKAVDNVFFMNMFQKPSLPFREIVQGFKDSHHPSYYNAPDAALIARLDFDLTYPNRPNKFQDSWRSIVGMKETFLLPGMLLPSVLAFCPEDNEYINDVIKAGADHAGSKEMIKLIQNGELNTNDFEYIICHPTILQELTAIRGIIKKKFPTVKNRTVNANLADEVKRLKSGVKIQLTTTDKEPDYGYIETVIGKLDMSTEGLEENLSRIIKDSVSKRVKGKDVKDFLLQCSLRTSYDKQVLNVDFHPYVEEFLDSDSGKSSIDSNSESTNVSEEEKDQKVKATQ